ncbi:MAG TPA: phosphate acyltransferase PlsX [Dehalococcoidia bacterium]|nr:phosphate acyltransferase PlsX [Dehalococcoidia bacterium]
MKIALDAMGGDYAPSEPIKAAVLASKEYNCDIALVGFPDQIQAELQKYGPQPRLSIVAATDTIAMEEDKIVAAVRQHPEASINVAMQMVKDGTADGMVSAGNSGAVMASAFFKLGRIRGIERPAMGTLLPYNAGKLFLIDIGANADCRPNHLVQFGEMASVYMEKVIGVPRPRVGLLNQGEEDSKGNELIAETFERLKESKVNFIGNVEGQDIHKNVADIVVADGFTGNVALKVGEGVADYILQEIRGVIKSSPLFISAALLLRPALRKALKRLNYEEYGGANLLGVNGVVVIAHGRSKENALKNALRVANHSASRDLIATMKEAFVAEPVASNT